MNCMSWTLVYIDAPTGLPIVTITKPYNYSALQLNLPNPSYAGSFGGAVGADVVLSDISAFISKIDADKPLGKRDNKIFIIEKATGILVAASWNSTINPHPTYALNAKSGSKVLILYLYIYNLYMLLLSD